MRRLIVVMAKRPAPGLTKTRLSPPLSSEHAAELYRCFLLDKLRQVRSVEIAEPAVAYWPPTEGDFFADLAPGFRLISQEGEGLAERLVSVFAEGFGRGYDQVMAVDGDTPTLPPDYFRQGFEGLGDSGGDVILGPCEDGGYYAIGMMEPHPTLFEVAMSTPHVLDDTLAQAEAAGLDVELLPAWYDVDTPADLERLRAELAAHPERAPATSQFLARYHYSDAPAGPAT